MAERTVHGTAPCTVRVCAEDFLLPDCVLELGDGLELAPELELEPVLLPLTPEAVTWPEISVDEKRDEFSA